VSVDLGLAAEVLTVVWVPLICGVI